MNWSAIVHKPQSIFIMYNNGLKVLSQKLEISISSKPLFKEMRADVKIYNDSTPVIAKPPILAVGANTEMLLHP